jgi:ABC-type sugar transport system substrate-binding protein
MEDITIRFFAAGDAGDPFASIVYRGAQAAQKALGVKDDYVESQDRALAETAMQKFNLKKGDRVIVFGNWGMPGRYIREGASADAFTKAGIIVTKLTITNEQIANTQLLLPVISGAILATTPGRENPPLGAFCGFLNGMLVTQDRGTGHPVE